MKTKTIWTLIIAVTLAMALTLAGQAKPETQTEKEKLQATEKQKDKKSKISEGFSADDAYKANCTRCHSELPKVSERQMKTIIRHMRVRANMTSDEAKAILEYMTQ